MEALDWPELFESPNPPSNCETPSIPCARDDPGNAKPVRRSSPIAMTNTVGRVIFINLETADSRRTRKTKAWRAGYKNLKKRARRISGESQKPSKSARGQDYGQFFSVRRPDSDSLREYLSRSTLVSWRASLRSRIVTACRSVSRF